MSYDKIILTKETMIFIFIISAFLGAMFTASPASAQTKWIGGANGCMDIPGALEQWKCQNPHLAGDAEACRALRAIPLSRQQEPDPKMPSDLRQELADAASQCKRLGYW
jgi:hypothetical protein